MISSKPGKQRKELFNAPMHKRRAWISSHLEESLLLKYDKRAVAVIKGDTVKVMRGSFKGHENKVAKVNVKDRRLEIEGITMSNAKGNKLAKPIHASNVLITKLNLTDKWRKEKLTRGLSEETKKEIEKEAEVQLKEAQEEQKRKEEEAKAKALEEEKAKQEETAEEIAESKNEQKEETIEKKTEPEVKMETKEPIKKETTEKKKTPKKTQAKKAPKEEENK